MAHTAAPFKSGQRVKVTEGSYKGDTGTVWKALADYSLVKVDRKGEGSVRIRTSSLATLEEAPARAAE